jgi:L-fucose isomerase-like protein
VLFHCGNWPNDLVGKNRVSTAPILGTTVGEENTWGALEGRASSGPMSYARISTDDASGSIKAYIGDGSFTDDPLDTFGNHAVVQIPGLNRLMTYICNNGFEHHVAIGSGHSASVLSEAFGTYLGWDVYHHAD